MADPTRFLLRGVLALAVGLVLAGCGSPDVDVGAESSLPDLEGLPTVELHGDDFHEYSVEKLIEASDVVVSGTVVALEPGRFSTAPDTEDYGGEQRLDVSLKIDEVFWGSDFVPGDMVSIDWPGYEVDRDGRPTRVVLINGIPLPRVESTELWFLVRHPDRDGWVVPDSDDARYARSGGSLRALADTAGPAAAELEQLGVNGLRQLVAEGLDGNETLLSGETAVVTPQGEGWALFGYERGKGIGGHPASIVTSERGLARAWELGGFDTPFPDVGFGTEVVVILTPGVSGSCPDIEFKRLVIGNDEVRGDFNVPGGSGVCTSDFNPITFFFVVERQVLTERFTLSVSSAFDNCDGCSIEVDLENQGRLEAELWGSGVLALATAGSAPPEGAFNVVQWSSGGDVGALLFSKNDWSEFPTWFQSFDPSFEVDLVEGFVATCTGDQCEECEGPGCADLPRIGRVCSQTYKPEPYLDQTFVVEFDGTECSIAIRPGDLAREP